MEGTEHSGAKFAAAAGIVIVALVGLWYAVMRAGEPPQPQVASATATTTPDGMVLPFASTTAAAPASDAAPAANGIDTNPIRFEVVTTEAAQEQGLSDRTDVPADYAMLFAFPKDDQYGFWMKDMLVPLDMIWLSDDHRIIKIDADVAADTYPTVFYPPQPVRYVLEMKAGAAKARNWAVGAVVTLPPGY